MSENAKKYLAWLSNWMHENYSPDSDLTDEDEMFGDHVAMLEEAKIISPWDSKLLLREFNNICKALYPDVDDIDI